MYNLPNNRRAKKSKIPIPRAKIRAIKGRLPHGSYQRIADECDTSYGYVSDVMNGWRYNKSIILKAMEVVREREMEEKRLEEAMDNL